MFKPTGLNQLDDEIRRLTDHLANTNPVDEDYQKIAKNLQTLMDARSNKNDRVISNEVIFAFLGNVLITLIVLNYEKTGVISTKAFNLLGRR